MTVSEKYDEKIAWLRQLLAWKDDVEGERPGWQHLRDATLDDRPHLRALRRRRV
ncbi:MAG: Inactive (p)ppGpp 3'-pyrophosphohydrolase domain / GTP pyrophosphokinase (EC, (p)ppGpp synthetase I [uncultured Caballeronia sp.]|nr:MAG: Inactive (p)ppGpp 3'-pyrophosphohydrolase domain / GTP pyrophosphokinase (EC, (p)ppGpp synthetase I [uncultured Caballeronia sp.]